MRGLRRAIGLLIAVFALLSAPGLGRAETAFPTRTVKMIVPYPPGGGTDLLARVLAQRLGEKWKQSVIVENVGGAGGNVGAEQVYRAAPDGYTLLFASPGPLATNVFMYKTMPYDVAKWTPLAVVATSPYVLVVSPHFAASDIAQVIADAKAKPGALTSATPGIGSLGQFATIEFEMLARVKLLQVPYKGLSPAIADVLGGNVNMMFDMLATALPLHKAGKEKIVAVGSTNARRGTARCADARGSRRLRLSRRDVLRPGRAAEHARRARRQDQPRRGRLHEGSGVHRQNQGARHGPFANEPRRRREILCRRAHAVGQGGKRGQARADGVAAAGTREGWTHE